jgi:hypothetical protein
VRNTLDTFAPEPGTLGPIAVAIPALLLSFFIVFHRLPKAKDGIQQTIKDDEKR